MAFQYVAIDLPSVDHNVGTVNVDSRKKYATFLVFGKSVHYRIRYLKMKEELKGLGRMRYSIVHSVRGAYERERVVWFNGPA